MTVVGHTEDDIRHDSIDYSAEQLLTMPTEQRHRIMAAQAKLAAPLYEEDLALPLEERELTVFTSLNQDPVYESGEYMQPSVIADRGIRQNGG